MTQRLPCVWAPTMCQALCYALSHVVPGRTAIKHHGARMNGKRDGRYQDVNPSLSDSKPRAFNH